MRLALTYRSTGFALAALLVGAGCSGDDDSDAVIGDADSIAAALEQERGGLSEEDEAPGFGIGPELGDLRQDGVDIEINDPLDADAEVDQWSRDPAVARYRVAAMWGRLPFDPRGVARNWGGRLRVNRGALLLRSTVAFEAATDRIRPREDRRTITFDSTTRPHADGVTLTVFDPSPDAAEPLALRYEADDGLTFSFPLADLTHAPLGFDVDENSNRLVAAALPRPQEESCQNGFIAGRWHSVTQTFGVLLGRVVSTEGAPIGHLRGIWGERKSGARVFFGKYIDRDGRFRGIFAGVWADGAFAGRWLIRGGEAGRLGGEYRVGEPSRRQLGGHFIGRFAETSCAIDVGAEAPGA